MYSPVYNASSSNSSTSTTKQRSLSYTSEPNTEEDDLLLLPPLPYKMLHNEILSVRIYGIPKSGVKSRVETQIKLSLQLSTQYGQKVVGWSYIQLNEKMLARSRFRKNQHILDGSVATMVSDESKVLYLEAKVVCSNNMNHPIKMCMGCVRREKKRAERSKSKENTIMLPKDLEVERNRILLFNCQPMVSFSSGDAILPTRITCYCRHHHEKIGFKICFTMKDYKGKIIATGTSPPIMITDDHKSLKQATLTQSNSGILPEFSPREIPPEVEEDTIILTPRSADRSQDNLFNIFPQNPAGVKEHPLHWPQPKNMASSAAVVPQVDRLIPTEGPVYGGMDVTLLGSGFYRGLTCLFGERPAMTTFYNANTLVCVLPPATHTGPVAVSFQEHPFMDQRNPIFTYKDASDLALYELALQVVGVKMTGKLHDPKEIAMHLVQGGEPVKKIDQQQLLNSMIHQQGDLLPVQNAQGHTLLHLAVLLNSEFLVRELITAISYQQQQEGLMIKFLNKQDRNKMTALDCARKLGFTRITYLLEESLQKTCAKKVTPSKAFDSQMLIDNTQFPLLAFTF